jgi:hypothetical protein
VPASRDYADAWRDSWATLLQVPVAGLLAVDYIYQQWVERSATFLSQVSTGLALVHSAGSSASPDNVMADVVTDDLVEATRALVRELVSLPGETAEYFNRHLEKMINDVLRRVQPDAGTDVRTYVVNELDKLNRGLSGLREVAAAETARRTLATPADMAAWSEGSTRDPDEAALENLLADLRTMAASLAGHPAQRGDREMMPRERMLLIVQEVINAALARFPPATPPPAPADLDTQTRAEAEARLRLAVENAQQRLADAQRDLEDERQGLGRPRARRESGQTRRSRR